jgi:hypothetical protein
VLWKRLRGRALRLPDNASVLAFLSEIYRVASGWWFMVPFALIVALIAAMWSRALTGRWK